MSGIAVRSTAPVEAPATLAVPPPRALGLLDQLGLWANLGISLLIPVTATFLVPAGQSVVACSAYFLVETLRRPLGGLTSGGWTGFWTSTDLVIALPVSWIPLVADYSRFSRTGRVALLGTGAGYAVSSAVFFLLGVLALRAYPNSAQDVVGALLAVPAGALALVILAVDEVDEAFANIYSTATSAQNAAPLA